MRLKITLKRGKLIAGRDQLAAVLASLDGEYMVSFLSLAEPHTPAEWRKLYFHLRDILHDSVETGYTKKELHETLRTQVFDLMNEDPNPEWFTAPPPQASTTMLTAPGWREFMKHFRELVRDTFELDL